MAPALSGPTSHLSLGARFAIEPPPEPTDCTFTALILIGKFAIVISFEISKTPDVMRLRSVEVPPISKLIAF